MFVNALDLNAFFSNPIGYIKDAEKTRQEYLLAHSVPAKDIPQITETFQDPIGVTPVINTIGSGIKNVWTGLTDTIKNLPLLVMMIVGGLIIYLVLMGKKGKQVI